MIHFGLSALFACVCKVIISVFNFRAIFAAWFSMVIFLAMTNSTQAVGFSFKSLDLFIMDIFLCPPLLLTLPAMPLSLHFWWITLFPGLSVSREAAANLSPFYSAHEH